MTRLERRVFYRSLTIGGLLTLMVLGASALGLLDSLEYWLYDQRAIHCQLAEPQPTSQFVHLDIDDGSVSPTALGRWPWPRAKLAQILEEIHRAGPTVIGLDIMFSEPQSGSSEPGLGGKPALDDDQELAKSLADCGNTVLAASFQLESTNAESDIPPHAMELLLPNLEIPQSTFFKRLADKGDTLPIGKTPDDLFLRFCRKAMKTRIDQEVVNGPVSLAVIARRLLPHTDPSDQTLPLNQLLADQYALSMSEHAVARFSSPPQTLAVAPARGTLNVVPLAMFSNNAASVAFANYDIFENATVRSIPLYVEFNHRLYPQMAIATACVMRGADPAAVHFEGSTAVIPAPGGAIRIPTFTFHSKALGRDVPLIAAVPWFGRRDWETMYDWPNHRDASAHVSLAAVWDICAHRANLAADCQTIDLAIDNLLNNQRPADQVGADPDLAQKYLSAPLDPYDLADRQKRAAATLESVKPWQDVYAQTAEKDLSADDRARKLQINDAVPALNTLLAKAQDIQDKIDSRRLWLKSKINGKGTLIGFTATGFQDQVPTSLHIHAPGVVVHGVVVNAVLTGNWWRVAPPWVAVLLTILFGMGAAFLQGRYHPLRASVFVLGLVFAYLLINGFILFDWDKWVVGVATPSVTMLAVWAGTTLDRVLVEAKERNRIAMEVAVISKEMDLARQVQVALIPTRAPTIVGLESAGWALTASVTGGDCYDLWQLQDGRLAILLADASGHGLAPAMIVSQVRTLARSLCEFECHPHDLLERINLRLADDLESTRFVTAFLGFLAPDGTLDWASAGHGPMYWTPGNGAPMLELDSTGMPLGIQPEFSVEPKQAPLKLGENGSLIVFSDGLFEAPAPDGNMFGVERVKEILDKTCGQPCTPILEALREAVQKWQQKTEPIDDQTIVIVRRVAVS